MPKDKVWHAVGERGEREGRSRQHAEVEWEIKAGAKIVFMLCLIQAWFERSAILRHAVKNSET